MFILQLAAIKRNKKVDWTVLCFGRCGFTFVMRIKIIPTISGIMFGACFCNCFVALPYFIFSCFCYCFCLFLVLFGGGTCLPDEAALKFFVDMDLLRFCSPVLW